ncbi:CHAT domain-containing protein, partial [Nocardioides stalactiti]|uniref:CHAT domain-containing protein n=1 Tax=Nocardioides stalactiti TaxID=2755356 RepID=UPI00160253C0
VAPTELAVADRLFADCGSRLMRARTWLTQAALALSEGDVATARDLCSRVLDAGVDDDAPYLGVQARLTWARVEEVDVAEKLLDAAAELAVRAGIPPLRVDVLIARARLERRLGDSQRAVESLRRAVAVGRSWQRRFGETGAGSAALTEAAEELVELLLERNDHAGPIEAWQRVRMAKADATVSMPDRSSEESPVQPGQRHERLRDLLATATRPILSAGAPEAEVLPAVPWGPLVEYYVAGEDVLAFVVRDGQVDARRLVGVAGETRRLVTAWQQECRLMAPGAGAPLGGVSSSLALDGLYDALLAPLADLLECLEEDLTVEAHRHLHAVPFDALLDEIGPWFSMLHGAVPLRRVPELPVDSGMADVAAVVLAVPDANAPLITAEAEMIFRLLPSTQVLLGRQATRDALARLADGADVVHFACHGVFRQENPLSSALHLGDGWLQARDIASQTLGLDRSVVVLSACGSGLSPDYLAEPIGLASACLAAGARGVVAALWTVDDAVTFELMTHFYKALSQGRDPACALRSARREVAERYPHPYYWAAFRYFAPERAAG